MNKMAFVLMWLFILLKVNAAYANVAVEMYSLDKNGENIKVGTIYLENTIYGLLVTPRLHNLPPGIHGLHVYSMPGCEYAGRAGQRHFDPIDTRSHRGPYKGSGHLGDLPVLIVDAQGQATLPTLAPRLKVDMIVNHSLGINTSGDNYSDCPEKSGGGGPIIVCGDISYVHKQLNCCRKEAVQR